MFTLYSVGLMRLHRFKLPLHAYSALQRKVDLLLKLEVPVAGPVEKSIFQRLADPKWGRYDARQVFVNCK